MRHVSTFSTLLVLALFLLPAGTGCSKKSREARLLNRANHCFEAGDYDRAEIEYGNVMKLDSTNAFIQRRLATILIAQTRYVRARLLLEGILADNPNDYETRLQYAELQARIGYWTGVRSNAAISLLKMPGHPEGLRLLAMASISSNETAQTRQILTQTAAKIGDTAAIEVANGILFGREGDATRAEAAFQRALAMDPTSSYALVGLAGLRWKAGDTAGAESLYRRAAESAPVRSGPVLDYATFKLRTGDKDGARTILLAATQKAPDYLPGLRLLAGIALEKGETAECGRLLNQVLSREPLDFEALMRKAHLEVLQRRPEQALEILGTLSRMYTNSPAIPYELGVVYSAMGQSAKSITVLNQALSLDTNHAPARLLLARQYLRQGNILGAIAHLNALCRAPNPSSEAYMLMGEAFLSSRPPAYEQALDTYRKLSELTPRNADPVYRSAKVYLSLNKPTEARRLLEKCLELEPGNFKALEDLISLDLQDKQFDSALRRLQPYLDKAPDALAGQLLLSRIHRAQGNYPQAEADLKRILSADPTAHGAYLQLAEIYSLSGRNQQALDQLQTALAKRTNDWGSLLMMATIHKSMGNPRQASQAYERILVGNPRNLVALNNLAGLYSKELKQPDRALALARQARELSPRSSSVADTLGWILYQRGDYTQAAQLLFEAAEAEPSDWEIQYHLGMTLYMLGREPLAATALQRALDTRQPGPSELQAIKQALALLGMPTTVPPTALPQLEKALRERPSDPVALGRIESALKSNGKTEVLARYYEDALSENPNCVLALVGLAELTASRPADRAKAIALARKARDSQGLAPSVGHRLGNVLWLLGEHKPALGLLLDSSRSLPDDPNLLFDLSIAQFGCGNTVEAAASLEKALAGSRPFPRQAEARETLTSMRVFNDPTQIDRHAMEIAAAVRSNQGKLTWEAVSLVMRLQKGDTNAAVQEAEQLIASYPSFAPALKMLARLYAARPDSLDKAIAYANRAREALPDDADVARTLGLLAFRQGNYPWSTTLLKEGLRKQPNDAEALFYLGSALSKMKLNAESIQAFRQALALNLPEPMAQEARKSIATTK